MYIKHAVIKNFRGIEELELTFKPGVNILLGDNGSGKTTALDALAIALGGYLSGIQNLKVGGILQPDFRKSISKLAGASQQIIYYSPEIEFDFNIDGTDFLGARSRENRDGKTKTITRCTSLQEYARKLANDRESVLPLISYMGISRVTMAKRADYGKAQKNEMNDRRCGYIGCLDSTIDKENILEWIKKMSYESLLRNSHMPELTLFYKIVSCIMQDVNELKEFPTVVFSAEWGEVAYRERDQVVPISVLSAGYQSLLWMVMDFAFRLALLNPEMEDPSAATGVVLIDEIDMHLHPKWQWKVLDAFRRVFPKIQFIVATHSPIIISSCKDANLILFKNFCEIEYLRSAYAYPVDNVLSQRLNSTGKLPVLQKKISKFDRMVNSGKLDDAKALLTEMERDFGKDNTEVLRSRTTYELETLSVDE